MDLVYLKLVTCFNKNFIALYEFMSVLFIGIFRRKFAGCLHKRHKGT